MIPETQSEARLPDPLAKLMEGIDRPLENSCPVCRLTSEGGQEKEWWAPTVGVAILLILFGSLALVAAGGWQWFAGFLSGTASNWTQAIGGILAVIAAFKVGSSQVKANLALEKARQDEIDLRTVVLIDAALLYVQGAMGVYQLCASSDFPYVPEGTCKGLNEGTEILRKLDLFRCPTAQLALVVVHVIGNCDLFVQCVTSESEARRTKIGDKEFLETQKAVWNSSQLLRQSVHAAREVCAAMKTSIENGRGV